MRPRRVHVIGTSGSGKTTVAGAIADKLGIRHIELDAINWQPGWTELPKDQFYERVREETEHGDWTIEIIKLSDTAKGIEVLPRRWVVERTFAWLGRCRRLAKDWDASIESSTAWAFISSIRLMTRRLARYCYVP